MQCSLASMLMRHYVSSIHYTTNCLATLVLGKFGPVRSGPRPFLLDQRLDSPVPDKIFGTGTGTAMDRLYQSGPGPDLVPACLAPLGLLQWPTGGCRCARCIVMSQHMLGQHGYSRSVLRSVWGMGEANSGL